MDTVTLDHYTAAAIFVCAAYGILTALHQIARYGWQRLNDRRTRLRARVVDAQLERLRPMDGKLVRHAPTGRVGLCVGLGRGSPPRGQEESIVQMVVCPACAHAIESAPDMGTTLAALHQAMGSGHTAIHTASEVTLATRNDAAAFRARMTEHDI